MSRARRATVAWVACAAVVGCRPTASTPPATARASEVSARQAAPAAPADPWRGRDLSALLVPLLGGGELDLASLRGQAVVLRVVAPGHGASDRGLAWARRWAAREAGPQVVLVSLDAKALELGARWGPIPPPRTWFGWDPQGAFAARLGVRRLPLVLLLGLEGTVQAAWEGEAPADADLDRALATAAPGSPPAPARAGE